MPPTSSSGLPRSVRVATKSPMQSMDGPLTTTSRGTPGSIASSAGIVHRVLVRALEDQVIEARRRPAGSLDLFEQRRRQQAVAVEPDQEIVEERLEALARDHPEVVAVVRDLLPRLVEPRRADDAGSRRILRR